MTRAGVAISLYALHVESCPFSRFTKVQAEQIAIRYWRERAMAWAETHVDAFGSWDGEV